MVKENIIIPKENKAQIEEVRELENKQQEQTNQSAITESVKEAVVPTVYASDKDDERQREGAKEAIGTGLAVTTAANPVVGGIAEGASAGVGAAMEGIGKLTGEEGMEKAGNVYKEAPAQPLKEAKDQVKKLFE